MIGLDLSGCVHMKRVKRDIVSFLLPKYVPIWYILLYLVFLLYYLKFSTPSRNIEFHIYQYPPEIGFSDVIKLNTLAGQPVSF